MVFGWVFAAHQVGAAVAIRASMISPRAMLLTYTPSPLRGERLFDASLLVLAVAKPGMASGADGGKLSEAAAGA